MIRSGDFRHFFCGPNAHEGALDVHTVAASPAPTVSAFKSDQTDVDDYYDDALLIGGGTWTPSTLYAHVRTWHNPATEQLVTLARELDAAPTAGDDFKLVPMNASGLYASSQEVRELSASGWSTISNVSFAHFPGKNGVASDHEIEYDHATTSMRYKNSGDSWGEWVDVSATGDFTLYSLTEDYWVEVTVASDPGAGSDGTDTIVSTQPEQWLMPHVEGYQSEAGLVRYLTIAQGNTHASDTIHELTRWVEPRSGTESSVASGTLGSAAGSLVITDAADWPERAFWVYNTDLSDYRYCKKRSGNTCYFAARGSGAYRRGATNTSDWDASDVVGIHGDFDIAEANPTANAYPDPSGLTYVCPLSEDDGDAIVYGDLAAGAYDGLAIRLVVPAGGYALDDLLAKIGLSFW